MKEESVDKLTKDEKKVLENVLKKMGCLPPTQGKVLINISPDRTVSSVEINMIRR